MAKKSSNPIQELETLSVKPKGLYSYPNAFSEIPQGAMLEAKNVVLDRPSVVEQRRGFSAVGTALSARANKLYSYQGKLIISYSNKLAYDSDGAYTWTAYSGTYTAPTGALAIHSFLANKNAYFTTAAGLKKLDNISGTIAQAGAPAGLDGSGSTTGSGWFANTTQVAYRIVFGYTDANDNLILGAPSQRIVVSNNSGGATNVSLTFSLPDGLATSFIYQIYRSPMSANLNTEPNDECALVYTGNPTAGELIAKVVTVTDNVPDSLKGEVIYTASSQQGILQANNQAPLATDAAYFKGFVFLANTKSKQEFFLTLVSVGSPGLQLNDTVTVAGTTYTAKATEVIASREFKLFTGGTPSQNITDTANSLVRVINRYSANTAVYAYYRSGYADLPGRIVVAERIIGGSAFNVASTRAGAFVPDIGTTTGTSASDPAFFGKNRVSISKYQQPEAYPTTNNLPIGSAEAAILRIIALRDYVLLFKEVGIFQIDGTDLSSFQEQEVDKTTILKGLETAVSLNNKVYMFTNQTVVSVTVNEGVLLKSQPILNDLLVSSSPLYPTFDTAAYAVAYESDNKYILGILKATGDTAVTKFYVYNYLSDAWSTWELPVETSCALVNPADNKLFFGSADTDNLKVYKERKNYNNTDYADDEIAVTVVGSSGYVVQLTSTTDVEEGFTLSQGLFVALITDVIDSTHVRVNRTFTWAAGAATVYKPIPVYVRFAPEPCGNPAITKHFKEVQAIFSNANFNSFNLGFYTDFNSVIELTTLVPKISGTGWGEGPWGEFPWGSGTPEAQVIRGYVPLKQRRGHWINVVVDYAEALTKFALDGFAVFHAPSSQRFH